MRIYTLLTPSDCSLYVYHLHTPKVLCQRRSEKFQIEERHNFCIFSHVFFFGKTNLKLIEKQERLYGGPGECSPGKFLKNLHVALAILVLFK